MKTPKRIEPLVEDGLVDEVIRPLMSGKEAAVYVVRCGDELRCAKVYKEANKRGFRQAAEYQEGRKVRNTRDARALYRQAGPRPARPRPAGEPLRYGISPCPLGYLLLAASAHGVCALLFGDQPAALEVELRQRFASAELQRDDHGLGDWLSAVLSQLHEPARAAHLPLDLRGTAFQQQVWQALQTIPLGQTRRYGDLAAQLATHPRAIARACASNPLGLLVPCHRVVAADGGLSGYRWGVARKEALLAAEAQSAATTPED